MSVFTAGVGSLASARGWGKSSSNRSLRGLMMAASGTSHSPAEARNSFWGTASPNPPGRSRVSSVQSLHSTHSPNGSVTVRRRAASSVQIAAPYGYRGPTKPNPSSVKVPSPLQGRSPSRGMHLTSFSRSRSGARDEERKAPALVEHVAAAVPDKGGHDSSHQSRGRVSTRRIHVSMSDSSSSGSEFTCSTCSPCETDGDSSEMGSGSHGGAYRSASRQSLKSGRSGHSGWRSRGSHRSHRSRRSRKRHHSHRSRSRSRHKHRHHSRSHSERNRASSRGSTRSEHSNDWAYRSHHSNGSGKRRHRHRSGGSSSRHRRGQDDGGGKTSAYGVAVAAHRATMAMPGRTVIANAATSSQSLRGTTGRAASPSANPSPTSRHASFRDLDNDSRNPSIPPPPPSPPPPPPPSGPTPMHGSFHSSHGGSMRGGVRVSGKPSVVAGSQRSLHGSRRHQPGAPDGVGSKRSVQGDRPEVHALPGAIG